jgi:hypothetical protein
MKLMTKEIERKLPPLYSQDGKKPEEVKIIVKYFHPLSKYTLYVTEGSRNEDGDLIFFGYVRSQFNELGYSSLREIEAVRVRGLKMERDLYFGYDHTLAEVQNERL